MPAAPRRAVPCLIRLLAGSAWLRLPPVCLTIAPMGFARTDYDALRAGLEQPVPRVIADWHGYAHPHEVAEDAGWPSPRRLHTPELSRLRDRLGWDAWRTCLWTAAELAVPVFRAYAWRAEQPDDGAAAPVARWVTAAEDVVAAAHAVLWQAQRPLRLYEAGLAFFAVDRERLPPAGRYAWYAVRNALHGWTGGVRQLVHAWLAAGWFAMAAPAGTDGRGRGYDDDSYDEDAAQALAFAYWWRRCRCRLAFADAALASTTNDARMGCQAVVTRAVASRQPYRAEASGLVLHWLNRAGDGRGIAESPDGPE